MEFLSILGALARRRGLVALGAVVALGVGMMTAGVLPFGPGSTPGRPSGVAQARVVIDHRNAMVADTAEISDTVGTQAALFADLMSGDAQRDAIAQRAGVPPDQLGMQRVQFNSLFALGQLPERAAKAAATIARPFVVNVWAATPLPIVTIDVLAPSAAGAERVARATRDTLDALTASRAPNERRRVVVRPLGPVRSAVVVASAPSPWLGVVAGILIFVLWCCAVVVATGVRRAWRTATAEAPDAVMEPCSRLS